MGKQVFACHISKQQLFIAALLIHSMICCRQCRPLVDTTLNLLWSFWLRFYHLIINTKKEHFSYGKYHYCSISRTKKLKDQELADTKTVSFQMQPKCASIWNSMITSLTDLRIDSMASTELKRNIAWKIKWKE